MRGTTRTLVVTLSLIAFVGPLGPVFAQEPAIGSELAGIRASLERIVQLLERQAVRSQGDLILRRLEIKSTRLIPIEERLRSTRASLSDIENERASMRTMFERFEDEAFNAETEEERANMRQNLLQGERALEQIEQRSASLREELDRLVLEHDQLAAEVDQLERELDGIEAKSRDG